MTVVLETEEDSVSCGILNNCSRKGEELFFPGHPLGAGTAGELLNTEVQFEPFFHEEGVSETLLESDSLGINKNTTYSLQWCCSVNTLEQTPAVPWSRADWQAADKPKQVWGMLVLFLSLLYFSWGYMQIHEMVLISSTLVFKYYALFLAHISLLAWTYLTHRQCEKTTDKNL